MHGTNQPDLIGKEISSGQKLLDGSDVPALTAVDGQSGSVDV